MAHEISIIIPYYNDPNGLTALLNTIPLDENIQVIIINDCSTDFQDIYFEIKKEYEKKGYVFLETEVHLGAGAARNKGLKEYADGKWILFADSDDYFVHGAFDVILSQTSREEDIIFFPPTSVYLNDGSLSNRHVKYENMVSEYLRNGDNVRIKCYWTSPWSKLIRKKLIDINNIFFDEILVSNDVMFSTKCSIAASDIAVCNKVIYCITSRRDSLTTRYDLSCFKLRVHVWVNRYKYLRLSLSKDDFDKLQLNLNGWMSMALFKGYGVRTVFWILAICIKHGIPVLKYLKLNRIISSMNRQTKILEEEAKHFE